MENKYVIVAPSKIEGLGLFAKVNITAGQEICSFYGKEMSFKEFKELYEDSPTRWRNVYKGRNIFCIVAKEEPYLHGNLINYINEGPENVFLKRRKLYASCNIKKGEELFLTYHKNYPRPWLS